MRVGNALRDGPGCHLCDEAREAIAGAARELPPFELSEVDIERDDGAARPRYLERIPVVEVDGEVVSELDARAVDLLRASLDTVRR